MLDFTRDYQKASYFRCCVSSPNRGVESVPGPSLQHRQTGKRVTENIRSDLNVTCSWCGPCELKSATGLLRHYNPVDGRWINRDPIGERGGLNLYCSVHNNNVIYVDADGRFINIIGGAVVGGAIGGISAYWLGGDVAAGIIGGAVTGGLITAGVPPNVAGLAGGAINGFVSAYNTAAKNPKVCSSKIGFVLHYSTRIVAGAAGGYYGGVLGDKMNAVFGTEYVITIAGTFEVKAADVVTTGTIDLLSSGFTGYAIDAPEAMVESIEGGIRRNIDNNNTKINISIEETSQ